MAARKRAPKKQPKKQPKKNPKKQPKKNPKKQPKKQPARKRAARRGTSAGAARPEAFSATEASPVEIGCSTGHLVDIAPSKQMEEMAVRWSYVLRNRSRWTAAARRELAARARADLVALGLEDDALERLAQESLLEVRVPYLEEQLHWASRIMPWEYLISAGTRDFRTNGTLTIIRNLWTKDGEAPTLPGQPKAMVIVCAPGRLGSMYEFDSEIELVRRSLDLDGPRFRKLINPTEERLRAELVEFEPDVVHLTGVDAREGAALLDEQVPNEMRDGIYIRGRSGRPEVLDAEGLANILALVRPKLFFCTTQNSAARIAALAVAKGAGSAMGFQDSIDDALAESFAETFYLMWRESGYDTVYSFAEAMASLLSRPRRMRGSGVVLWSNRSIREEARSENARAARARTSRDAAATVRQRQDMDLVVSRDPGQNARDLLECRVKAHAAVNYSLLHNDRSLFELFELRTRRTGRVRDVLVEVRLVVGSDEFGYRETMDVERPMRLDDASEDPEKRVRVPLTWDYVRSMRESTRSVIYVRVSTGGQVAYERTLPVILLPAEEWEDTPLNQIWLPSFVMPRDPGIERVIASAQGYLRVLADDSAVGFDGYQSIDPDAESIYEGVDLQVRAIWSALLHSHPLGYINPPPSYTGWNQRLRSPSSVIDGARGTCIDLALLLASCLEYVDIYPVIFLLKGHAFPGYWRGDALHEHFAQVGSPDLSRLAEPDHSASPDASGRTDGFILRGPSAYREICNYVDDESLVPIESVDLTSGTGFGSAVDDGLENLQAEEEFDCLIDIHLARQHGVTPLPMSGAE